eukprot:g5302.t1
MSGVSRLGLSPGHLRQSNFPSTALRSVNIPNSLLPRHRLSVQARAYEAGIGLFGTKCGMTNIFTDEGNNYGVTVIELEEGNKVAQVKTKETDGYDAVQVAYKVAKEKRVKKPIRGHLSKHGCPPMKKLREFKLKDAEKVKSYTPGQQLKLEEIFKIGDKVDVAGTTIGKGFQGEIKRWHHSRGMKTHGSKSYRQHGSIGSGSSDPSRVFPGMKMAGRMGNKRTKIRKLEIMDIDLELGIIAVKGSVPGKPGNVLEITPAKIVGVNC